MELAVLTRDAPPRVCGGDLVAFIKSDAVVGGGEVAETGVAPEPEVRRAEDDAVPNTRDAPPRVCGGDLVAFIKFDAVVGGGEVAETGAAPEPEVRRAEDDAAPSTRDAPPLLNSTGLGGAAPPVFGDDGVELLVNGARGLIRAACGIFLRAADASSRVLSWLAREPLFVGVARSSSRVLSWLAREPIFVGVSRFVPLAEEAAVTLAAACFLIANPATVAAAHQERPLRWWFRGALRHAADAAYRFLLHMTRDPVVLFLPGLEEFIIAVAAAAYLVDNYLTGRRE